MLAVEVVELNSLLTCCVHKSRDLKRETRTTRENRETHDPNLRKPIPVARVWVFTGWGPGWPGIPQGYPCYSLYIVNISDVLAQAQGAQLSPSL